MNEPTKKYKTIKRIDLMGGLLPKEMGMSQHKEERPDLEQVALGTVLKEHEQSLCLKFDVNNCEGRSSFNHYNKQLPALKTDIEILLEAQAKHTAEVLCPRYFEAGKKEEREYILNRLRTYLIMPLDGIRKIEKL